LNVQVKWKDPETGEEIDTGLVKVKAVMKTEGGVAIDIGRSSGNAGFGGEKAEADDEDGGDGGEDVEETKLDQFWNFPSIENEHTFSSFGDFKKNYWTPFLVAFQKMSVDKGLVKDDAEMKAKGRKIATNTIKWIKANFDSIQFFGVESYFKDGSEIDAKYDGVSFCANMAYLINDGTEAAFYFIKDTFKGTTF
jgi:hypothetical protein